MDVCLISGGGAEPRASDEVPCLLSLDEGIYGMSFEHMPELDWKYGYPMALAVMASLGLLLARYFRG
jgi:Mg2+ and Co2+ transporters